MRSMDAAFVLFAATENSLRERIRRVAGAESSKPRLVSRPGLRGLCPGPPFANCLHFGRREFYDTGRERFTAPNAASLPNALQQILEIALVHWRKWMTADFTSIPSASP